MKKLLVAAILGFLMTEVGSAQLLKEKPFEGMIDLRKMSVLDTNEYTYYIKGDHVRIDEIDSKTKTVAGSFLIDLKLNTMISLSHDRKLYMDQKPNPPPVVKGQPEIIITKNPRTILDVKCTEYVVKNKEENADISFFISNSGKYAFFVPLLKVLDRKDKFSSYYLRLTGVDELFPFLAIQRDLNGKETGRIETLKMEKKELNASMFDIPAGYTKFDK